MELNQDARSVLDAMREGINIIDAEGRIIFGNKAYLDFLSKETGIGIGSIEGQYLRDLRPGARLPEVLATGKPILHAPRMEKQDEIYFVNMYPIFQDGKMVGACPWSPFSRMPMPFKLSWSSMKSAISRCCTGSTRPTPLGIPLIPLLRLEKTFRL